MTDKKTKLLGTAYINLLEVDGETKFEYGYELDKINVSLNDMAMFLSFLDILQDKAKQDFKDRLDVQEKEYSIERGSD